MKKYKFTTSGINKKGQRTSIFEREFYAKSKKEFEDIINELILQYCNKEPDLDFINYTINEIIFLESKTIQY